MCDRQPVLLILLYEEGAFNTTRYSDSGHPRGCGVCVYPFGTVVWVDRSLGGEGAFDRGLEAHWTNYINPPPPCPVQNKLRKFLSSGGAARSCGAFPPPAPTPAPTPHQLLVGIWRLRRVDFVAAAAHPSNCLHNWLYNMQNKQYSILFGRGLNYQMETGLYMETTTREYRACVVIVNILLEVGITYSSSSRELGCANVTLPSHIVLIGSFRVSPLL